MKCYSLLLGARNTPQGSTRFSAEDDEHLRTITFRYFRDGFTILNADGGWFDPGKKAFIEEESRQILVCATRAGKLRAWCEELARTLGQTELLVVEHGPATTFRLPSKKKRRRRAHVM